MRLAAICAVGEYVIPLPDASRAAISGIHYAAVTCESMYCRPCDVARKLLRRPPQFTRSYIQTPNRKLNPALCRYWNRSIAPSSLHLAKDPLLNRSTDLGLGFENAKSRTERLAMLLA